MGSYVPGTKQEQQEMLREIGYAGFEEMSVLPTLFYWETPMKS